LKRANGLGTCAISAKMSLESSLPGTDRSNSQRHLRENLSASLSGRIEIAKKQKV